MTWFLMALFMCQVMYLSLEEFSKNMARHVDAGILTCLTGMDSTIKSGCPFPFSQLWEPDFLSCRKAYAGEKGAGGAGDGMPVGILVMGAVRMLVTIF